MELRKQKTDWPVVTEDIDGDSNSKEVEHRMVVEED